MSLFQKSVEKKYLGDIDNDLIDQKGDSKPSELVPNRF